MNDDNFEKKIQPTGALGSLILVFTLSFIPFAGVFIFSRAIRELLDNSFVAILTILFSNCMVSYSTIVLIEALWK